MVNGMFSFLVDGLQGVLPGQASCRVNGLVVTLPPPPGERKPPLGIPQPTCLVCLRSWAQIPPGFSFSYIYLSVYTGVSPLICFHHQTETYRLSKSESKKESCQYEPKELIHTPMA